jgi:hypothetical protein
MIASWRQIMQANWLSIRVFKSFDDIVDHCCSWNTLIDQPWKIMSIARGDWARAGQLLWIGIRRLRHPVTILART